MYDPVVTLSTEDDNKLLELLIKVNRLFVFSLANEDDIASFSKYYTPKVEIKDFNVLIDGKRLFDVSVKNKEETYEKNY